MEEIKAIEKIKAEVTFTKSAEWVTNINKLIDRDTAVKGIPHEVYDNLNKCPLCGETFGELDNFCAKCGNRLKFVKSDVVPL